MMHVRVAGRNLILCSLCLFFVGLCVLAQSVNQIASETGLDRDLVGVLNINAGGTELAIIVVYINERAFQSGISKNPNLYHRLFPYVGQNALYINPTVEQVVSYSAFSPSQFSVEQSGKTTFYPTGADWVEITPGFLGGLFQVNPGGASYGSGSEGILVVGDRIDPTQPFSVVYQGQRAYFEISQVAAAPLTAVSPAPAPTTVPLREMVQAPPLADVTDLEEALLQGDLSAGMVAELLSVDPRLVGTFIHSAGTDELRFMFIRLEEAVRVGTFSSELLSRIDPYVGHNAIMVWMLTSTGAPFSIYNLLLERPHGDGITHELFFGDSVVDLTEDFAGLNYVYPGQLQAAILLLPSSVNVNEPFTMKYGLGRATFLPLGTP